MKTTLFFILSFVFAFNFAAAQEKPGKTPPWAGLWFGKGETFQEIGEYDFKVVTRRSDCEFWFRIQPDGEVVGQAYVSYSAELRAMEWNVALPKGEIDAKVEGGSEKTTFKIDLEGEFTPDRVDAEDSETGTLKLKAVGEDDDLKIEGLEFEFKIVAALSMPIGLGPVSGAEAGTDFTVISIPAHGWSPFQNVTPKIEAHPVGAMTVDATSEGEKFRIHWHATQVVPARVENLQSRVEELERALAELKAN